MTAYLTSTNPDVIRPTMLRVLGLVMDGHRRGRLYGIREMSRVLGVSPRCAYVLVEKLKKRGLVESGPRGSHGTLTPRCRFIPAAELDGKE